MSEISNERRRLADFLSEVAHGTVEEWMRIVEVDQDVFSPGSGVAQLRMRYAGDGTFIAGETQYSEEFGQYRLTVKVEALPDLPPIGPENDPAQIEEQRSFPEVCGLEWVGTTFLHIEQGDRLRIGQDEATVLSVFRSTWHAREGGWVEQRDPRGRVICNDEGAPKKEREIIPWERVELFAELDILPQRTQFPTDTAVEILCDQERKAQLALSEAGLEPNHA